MLTCIDLFVAAASKEKGQWLLADHVEGVVASIRAEWGADPLANIK